MAPSELTPLLTVFDETLLDAVLTKLKLPKPIAGQRTEPHSPNAPASESGRCGNQVDGEYPTGRLPLGRHDLR